MDRRHVLAGLAALLTLDSGCLDVFENDSTERESPDTTGESSPTTTSAPLSSDPSGAETDQPSTAQTPSHATPAAKTPPIDPTNLSTYTSDTDSYSVKYPATWRITNPSQGTARFTAPTSPARMLVRVKHGVPSVVPRETIISTAIRQAKRTYSLDQVTRMDQKEVTLSNDIPATVVNMRVRQSSSDMLLRGPFLVAHVTDTVYITGILVPERAYTPSVKQTMHTIVTSLTIQDAR